MIPACASSSPAFLMMYSACKLNKQGDNTQPWRTPFPIWTQSLFWVWFSLLLPALHAGFSGGRAGGLVSRLLNFPQFLVTFLPHLPFNFSAHFLDLWFFSFTRKFLSLHILGCWFTLKTEAPGELPETQHHPVYSQLLCWVRWPQAPLLTGDVPAEQAGFHHSELPVIPGLLMSGSVCQEQCCRQNFPQWQKRSFSTFLLYQIC